MTRKSHSALPLASSLTKLAATLIGAAAIAAPAHAGTISFESADPSAIYGSGDTYYESGYKLTFEAFDFTAAGSAVGSIVDSNDPGTCMNTSCPNNGSLFYGAFNDSIVILNSATNGAQFQLKSIDASFIGAFPNLGGYPAISGLLRMQAFRADSSYEVIDLPLFGPGANGFQFDTYDLLEPYASMNFVEIAMFGMVCNASLSCSAFNSNQGQFAIDNIVLAEVPEPASAAIFGLGLMGLVAGARRRKANANVNA